MKKEMRAWVQSERHDFENTEFNEISAGDNPIELFETWFDEALERGVSEPNAYTLATASKSGEPSARIVYMRDFTSEGFVSYTNYNSDKSRDLIDNPVFCANFFWQPLMRQVRVTGNVEKLDAKRSDAYFSQRPRESQIGAWASDQSQPLENREALEKKINELKKRFEGQEVPRPSFWGGFLFIPTRFEFWQGRKSRLHDRLVFTKEHTGEWRRQRVSP